MAIASDVARGLVPLVLSLAVLASAGCTAIVDPYPDCPEQAACGAYACAEDGVACKSACASDLDCGDSSMCDVSGASSDAATGGSCILGACQPVAHRELLTIFAGEGSAVDTFADGDFNIAVARTSIGSWALFTRVNDAGAVESVAIGQLVEDGGVRLDIVPRTSTARPGFYWVRLGQGAPAVLLTELSEAASEPTTTTVIELDTTASIVGLGSTVVDDEQVLVVSTTGDGTSLVLPSRSGGSVVVQTLDDSGFTVSDAAPFAVDDSPGVIYTRNNIARWETSFVPLSVGTVGEDVVVQVGERQILRSGEGDDPPSISVRKLRDGWFGTDDDPVLPNSGYRLIQPEGDAFYGEAGFSGTSGFTDSRIYDLDESYSAMFGELGLVDEGAGASMRFRYLSDATANNDAGWTRVATARDQRTSLVDGSISRADDTVDTVWLEWVREAGAVVYLTRWDCSK